MASLDEVTSVKCSRNVVIVADTTLPNVKDVRNNLQMAYNTFKS